MSQEPALPKLTAKKSGGYVAAINRLINGAMTAAKARAAQLPAQFEMRTGKEGPYRHSLEVELFHKIMNRKANENGLRNF